MDIRTVRVRKLRIADIHTELFSGAQGIGFKSVRGFILSIILYLSNITLLQKSLRGFSPCFLVIWPLVVVSEENEIMGYTLLNAEKGLFNGGFSTYLGISVKDGYRDMGIGTKLMQ